VFLLRVCLVFVPVPLHARRNLGKNKYIYIYYAVLRLSPKSSMPTWHNNLPLRETVGMARPTHPELSLRTPGPYSYCLYLCALCSPWWGRLLSQCLLVCVSTCTVCFGHSWPRGWRRLRFSSRVLIIVRVLFTWGTPRSFVLGFYPVLLCVCLVFPYTARRNLGWILKNYYTFLCLSHLWIIYANVKLQSWNA
jgi:hypothetical protein